MKTGVNTKTETSVPFYFEELKAIKYSDVKNIATSREKLENILLSSKIIFEKKEDVLDFFKLLLDYGYKESALNYYEEIIAQNNDYELIEGFNELLR